MIFIKNKYTKIYHQIIDNARSRVLPESTYTETHHCIPTSLGGPDIASNRVELTAREHFICHWLLVKMVEDRRARIKMVYALQGMKAQNEHQQRYNSVVTNRVYERYHIEHAKNHSETMTGRPAHNKGKKLEGEALEAQRERTRNRRKLTPEQMAASHAKRVAKILGKKRSSETKLKMSLAQKGKAKGPLTEDHRKAIGESVRGKPKREGHADNVRKANIGNISINKDGIEKKVKCDTLDQWLAEGWQLGGRTRKTK